MGREAWGCDDYYDGPNTSGLVSATIRRSAYSPRGQALLRELRAAIEVEPGLSAGWADLPDGADPERPWDHVEPTDVPQGCVCALGAMARARGVLDYDPLLADEDEGRAQGSVDAARAMGWPELLAREIVDVNDAQWARQVRETPMHGPVRSVWEWDRLVYRETIEETPEARKARVLAWIDRTLERAAAHAAKREARREARS